MSEHLKNSFPKRLSLNIVLIVSILFIITIAVAAFSSHKLIAEEALHSAENLLDATNAKIENFIREVELDIVGCSWVIDEKRDDPAEAWHVTQAVVENNKDVIGSTVAYVPDYFKGKRLYSPYSYDTWGELLQRDLADSYDYTEEEWFSAAFESGEQHWSEPYFDEGGGDVNMVTFSYPLKNPEGEVYAIMTADVILGWLKDFIGSIKPYPSSRVIVTSPNGFVMNNAADSLMPPSELIGEAVRAAKKGSKVYMQGSRASFMVYGPMAGGATAIITCAYKDVLSRSSIMHLILILVGLTGLLILSILCYRIIWKMTRPLVTITDAARSIAGGNFETVLPELGSEDEIGELRDTFEFMQTSIKDYMARLETTVAQKERFESELNIAAQIQSAMLIKEFPKGGGFDVHAIMHAAREVGGDFYDVSRRGDYLYFSVGDVSGKGVPASMYMAITKSAFSFISNMGLTMDQIVGRMNNAISSGNDSMMFVTMFAAKLNIKTGEMMYCNAGHNPIVLITPDGEASYLHSEPNLAIGLMPDFTYKMESVTLAPGSKLILYTDGVTEAERPDKVQYSEQRLLDWCAGATSGKSSRQICEDLFEDVRAFAEGADQNDDITILTLNL